MASIRNLEKRISSYLTAEQVAQVVRAYEYAKVAHEGQYRRSGDPYITHPLAVAHILTDMHMDHESLQAAMLHDVIEDTDVSKEELANEFSPEVAELVDGVSKIAQIKFSSKAEQQAENLRKMMLAMTQDIRVILVKLADRLHNMRTLHVMRPDKKRRIATETLEIYAPIANRLGMYNMRVEYEDLSFIAIHPFRSHLVGKAVKAARQNNKETQDKLKASLEHCLAEEGIKAKVVVREKHLYSIYTKMKEESKSFAEIMGVFGYRVLVDKVDSCYRALGVVHNYFTPVPGYFQDHIAIPKANGYQSLHTVLKSRRGHQIDIQIRTEEMESMANNGIAAHGLYNASDGDAKYVNSRAQAWMGRLMEMQQKAGDSMEFIENVKVDLFPDEIYVFTPRGEIKELPHGATPVDFAYAVHTKVGNTCIAAHIDGELATLSTPLETGQTVRVITSQNSTPNPSWLNFVVTGKARSNIRHFLKHQKHDESIRLGKRLLNTALALHNVSIDDIDEDKLAAELSSNNYSTMDDMLQDIGLGNRLAPLTANNLVASKGHDGKTKEQSLAISGTEGMLVSFAKCCYPLPGDGIMGHLSAGRGIVVHRDTCNNLLSELRNNPKKCLEVYWDDHVDQTFSAAIRIELKNQKGVLASLANIFSNMGSNIDAINMTEKDVAVAIVEATVSVKDRIQLARIIKRLRKAKSVLRINRING